MAPPDIRLQHVRHLVLGGLRRSVIQHYGEGPSIEVPDSVAVDVPFKEGPTRAGVSEGTASIEPYGCFSNTDSCEMVLIEAARRVTVSFADTGNATIVIVGGGGCPLWFQVFDSTGEFVAPFVECASFHDKTILPGTAISRTFDWWDRSTGLSDPIWLAPRTYSVVGLLHSRDIRHVSLPVSIELLANDP